MTQATAHIATLTSRSHNHVPKAQEEEREKKETRTKGKEARRTETRKATRTKEKVRGNTTVHPRKFAETTSREHANTRTTNANTGIQSRAVHGRRDFANGMTNVLTHTV